MLHQALRERAGREGLSLNLLVSSILERGVGRSFTTAGERLDELEALVAGQGDLVAQLEHRLAAIEEMAHR